ncbi:MAG: bifunctional folylpolyglutamate synthase/dihydrofolate synthase [Pirellulaceae bacterium]|nr:bifunctional folylpolyglutamate synthase/dihydrofolate synthase [Pirellulaceae bacterium]
MPRPAPHRDETPGSGHESRPDQTPGRDEAIAFLYDRINYERTASVPYRSHQFKLERMRNLLDRLGNPHLDLPIIHVAGTKGKGSTAAFLSSMLTASGYRTGLYTSPHLERLEERFAIDGMACPSEELVKLVGEVRAAVEPLDRDALAHGRPDAQATYFELTTAVAFLYFRRQRVDAAVLEVGLGGRLDSTNVCQPRVAVITSISFDHTVQLGNTLAQIAGEKAGIIKPGLPVVSGVLDSEAADVIRARAVELNCPLHVLGQQFGFDFRPAASEPTGRSAGAAGEPGGAPVAGCLDYWESCLESFRLPGLRLGLLGRHQAANAAVAIAAFRQFDRNDSPPALAAIRQGLAAARCPARIEVVAHNPTIILDTAHNVASIAALVETLRDTFAPCRRTLLLAASRDKDIRGMLRLLLPHFDSVHLTRYRTNPRAAEPQWLARLAGELLAEMPGAAPRLHTWDDPQAAWLAARQQTAAHELLCVTGSFFLAGELRAWT